MTLNLSRCDGGMVFGWLPMLKRRDNETSNTEQHDHRIGVWNERVGTSVETYNVHAAGTTNRISVMTLNSSFSAIRR